MYHVNTCSHEELKQLNIIANNCGISTKNITKFLNAFGDNNARYQLVWGWMKDPHVKLNFKGFKSFLRNIKIRDLNDWVKPNGSPLFKQSKFFTEDFIEY